MSVLEIASGPVRLSVEQEGEGAAVILLHGLTATRRYVVMGSRLLERSGRQRIAYDARGHGQSSRAPSAVAYAYTDLAADLLAVLDELAVDEAVIAGASMGAHTALRFALDHPERVAGLVLITPAYDPRRHGDAADLARWDALARGLRDGGVEGFLAAYGDPGVPSAWRETVMTVMRQRLAEHRDLIGVVHALQAVPRSRPFAALEELATITAPALIVGSRDEADPRHPLAVAQTYSETIPGARLVVEDPGRSPVAWQGAQLSRLMLELS